VKNTISKNNLLNNKGLITTTLAFFLLVNTAYYWESKLGLFAFPAFFLLVIVYFGLAITLLRQLYLTIKEKFKEKNRLLLISLLAIVLTLTFFKPFGIIDFNKFEDKDILVAEREGAANCMTTFKLKVGNKFTERSVCFGVTEIKGTYKILNDTIYFENVELGRHESEFYKFAVIRPSKFTQDNNHFDLIRYKNTSDTTGHELWITKNELGKFKTKEAIR
jgi:hypothetical protein